MRTTSQVVLTPAKEHRAALSPCGLPLLIYLSVCLLSISPDGQGLL